MCINIKDFYLNNALPWLEYLRIPISAIPEEIIELYNLKELEHNGYLYVEISKGMYGLPQAGRVANDALIPRLKAEGYTQSKYVPGFFTHANNTVQCCPTVEDFGVKYINKADALHLRDTLQRDYKITEDWDGANYCGLDLDWHYDEGYVDIEMKGYIQKTLQRFEHSPRVTI